MTTHMPHLTFEELATLMKRGAGITVDPKVLEERADATFADYGLDSLGLLGIVGELENRSGSPMPPDAEQSKTPHEFVNLINSVLTAGA